MNDGQVEVWALLGDASRRSIIASLSARPCSVTELADAMEISRPAVSQHLKVLGAAGIVHDEARGRSRVYSLDVARLEHYRHELDVFWSGALGGLALVREEEVG